MARRFSAPYQSEPVSSLATWSRNLAIFSVVAVVVSILIVRFGFLEMKPALATFFGALGCAGFRSWSASPPLPRSGRTAARGMGRIMLAFLINALVLAYPAYLAVQYRRLPPIHDITTDPIDPPRFEALARLRTGEGTNPAVYAGLYSAEQQRIAYPDIETVELEVPVDRAYAVTLQLVNRSANGSSSTNVRRSRRAASAASRRWRAPRSWVFARTSRSASRLTAKTPASISAPPRAISTRSRQQRRAGVEADRGHQ